METTSKIVVPISGGKDSQAALIPAMQDGREVIPVFNETGWDHPLTYEHLSYMTDFFGLSLQVTHYDEAPTIPEIVRKYKRFPFGRGRFCTSKFKQTAFKRWLDTQQGELEIWLGIRSEESAQRAKKYSAFNPSHLFAMGDIFPNTYPKRIAERCRYRLPLLETCLEDVFVTIKDAGMKHNPLYDMGFDRVGCFPCLIAGAATQKRAFATEFGKKQWKIIQELENDIGEKYKFKVDETPCAICTI